MDTHLTPLEALESCVLRAGSQSQMARDLEVSQPTIWKWLQSSKRMAVEHVLTAERLYGVSRHDLRPDIYPRNYPPAPDARERWRGRDEGVALHGAA